MAGDNPCYQCAEREVGCHSVCEKSLSWQKKNEERKKQKADDDIYTGYVVDSNTRRKQKLKKGGYLK